MAGFMLASVISSRLQAQERTSCRPTSKGWHRELQVHRTLEKGSWPSSVGEGLRRGQPPKEQCPCNRDSRRTGLGHYSASVTTSFFTQVKTKISYL